MRIRLALPILGAQSQFKWVTAYGNPASKSQCMLVSSHQQVLGMGAHPKENDGKISPSDHLQNTDEQTHHFLDLSRGAGFRGMRKRALIGCMSQRAARDQKQSQLQWGGQGQATPGMPLRPARPTTLWLHIRSASLDSEGPEASTMCALHRAHPMTAVS